MKWKIAAKMAALVMTSLGIKEIPIEENEVAFSDDQKNALKNAFKSDTDTNGEKSLKKMIDAFNKDLLSNKASEDAKVKLKEQLRELLQEANMDDAAIDEAVENASNEQLAETLAGVKNVMSNHKKQVEEMAKLPEVDSPIATEEELGAKIKHSATHLFGSNKEWDSFEGRNWNKRAAGLTTSATDFTDTNTITKLNNDLDLYFRENPDKITSLHRDNFGLPSFWPKRLNVDDKVADASIAVAEISQARKLSWLPKNRSLIKPEEGQIFPVQIDMEFVGYFLQKIEASWLNMLNKEGSQPFKMTFVMFLVGEFNKKARVEDRISTINGVYVETPEDATKAGKFINRQNGLLYQIYRAQKITKKYKAFSVGAPTTSNIVDYVDSIIESLPLDVRTKTGLVFYLSPYWLKAYKRRYEQIHGTQNDYSGYPTNPKDYNNVKFEVLHDMEGLDFMFITFDDNIELLENVPKEKSMYRFEYLRRIMYVYADYKQGVRLIHIGNKIKDGDPLEFKVQTIWSNDMPMFKSDFAVPIHDDGTGEISATFSHLKVASGWDTVITTINDAVPGQLIKIQGNTEMANARNITSAGNIDMGAAFPLKDGGTLTLFVLADGTIKEIARTTEPEAAPENVPVNFDGDSFDASEGNVFNFTGDADTTLDKILNGVEGQEITINGVDTVDVEFTVSDIAGLVDVTADVVLASSADNISLVNVGGVWYESSRTIA